MDEDSVVAVREARDGEAAADEPKQVWISLGGAVQDLGLLSKNNGKASRGLREEVEWSGLCFDMFTLAPEWKMDCRGHSVYGITS